MPPGPSSQTQPRVLVLSHFYKPEPIPKASDIAEAFARRGYAVEAVTGFPNYPAGKLYPGFRLKFVQRQQVDGVPVIRAWVWPYHGTSTLGRLVNYGTSMIGLIVGGCLARPCDVMYVWHPPLTTGLAAVIVSRLKRAPFVYDVQDIWPESAVWAGMLSNRFVIWTMHRLEDIIYRRAAHIIVVTEGARQNLITKGVDPARVSIGEHWIDDELFTAEPPAGQDVRREYGLEGKFVVMFAGNVGLVQALEPVLRAADLVKASDIAVVIVGDGVDRGRLMRLAKERNLDNVIFVDRQPMSRMPAILAAADALLVHLKDSEMAELAIPTKTTAYLAAGKPIVMAVRGAAADLVRRAGAGIVAHPEDPSALAAAFEQLARMPAAERLALGQSGRRYVGAHHRKAKVTAEYVELIERFVGG
jgi:putative colanic acid biosynthesis glycosyltransferase WcaI